MHKCARLHKPFIGSGRLNARFWAWCERSMTLLNVCNIFYLTGTFQKERNVLFKKRRTCIVIIKNNSNIVRWRYPERKGVQLETDKKLREISLCQILPILLPLFPPCFTSPSFCSLSGQLLLIKIHTAALSGLPFFLDS